MENSFLKRNGDIVKFIDSSPKAAVHGNEKGDLTVGRSAAIEMVNVPNRSIKIALNVIVFEGKNLTLPEGYEVKSRFVPRVQGSSEQYSMNNTALLLLVSHQTHQRNL